MKKNQVIYRFIAQATLQNKKTKFVMRDIARTLKISPNTVSLTVKSLVNIGAVTQYGNYFSISDFNKLIDFWAVKRDISKDIIYQTYADIEESEIEKMMPSEVAFTCYSAYVLLFGNDASDYSGVYVYASDKGLKEIKMRFPEKKLSERSKYFNITVLKPDQLLSNMIDNGATIKSSVSVPQLYVDLWNTKDWYAYEFLKKLKIKIDDMYAKAVL